MTPNLSAICGGLTALAILAGCAGNQALQWQPPKPVIKDRQLCDQWGCEWVTREEFNRVLRDIQRQMERL